MEQETHRERSLRLTRAIRKHRDARGDDRCWLDDEELYKELPEGFTPPPRDSAVELEKCKLFILNRHNPHTTYLSPEREIECLRQRLMEIRREAWIVYINNGWGDQRASNLSRTIYFMCTDVVGKEPNDKMHG